MRLQMAHMRRAQCCLSDFCSVSKVTMIDGYFWINNHFLLSLYVWIYLYIFVCIYIKIHALRKISLNKFSCHYGMGTSPPSCFLRLDTLTKFRSPWGYTRALSSQVSRYYHSWSDFPHWLDDGINPLLLNDDSKKFTPLLATMLDAIPTICGSLQPSNLRIDIPRSCLEESLVDRETLSPLLFPFSRKKNLHRIKPRG